MNEIEDLRAQLAAAVAERDNWIETARVHAKNEAYYRNLIVTTLAGTPAAFVSDDGSAQRDVLCAKLPELYASAVAAREEARAAHDGESGAGGDRVRGDEAVKPQLRYRVVSKREGNRPKVKTFATLAAAQRRLMLFGPEPWRAYGKGPDDLVCCAGGPECNCDGRTEREVTDDRRGELPPLEWVRIDVREVSPWRPLEPGQAPRPGAGKEGERG